jgi:hypothetical protein
MEHTSRAYNATRISNNVDIQTTYLKKRLFSKTIFFITTTERLLLGDPSNGRIN